MQAHSPQEGTQVNILVVDDKPEKVLALEVVEQHIPVMQVADAGNRQLFGVVAPRLNRASDAESGKRREDE